MDVLIMDMGDTIKGETQIDGYAEKMELLSFSHGIAQQITADVSNTKRTYGRPTHQDFTVTKFMDLATPVLVDFCNQAKIIPTVKIIIGQNDAGAVIENFVYTMTNVFISSVSVGGGGGSKPVETVSLNYGQIKWEYVQQQEAAGKKGTSSAVWDLSANKAQ